MKYCLMYGSLRRYSKRGYNFNRFSNYGEQIYIKDLTLNGFEMYDLGAYPAICKGNGKIKTELHSVTDEVYMMISYMETNAGYQESFVDLGDGIIASLFTMRKENLVKMKKVNSGDWA